MSTETRSPHYARTPPRISVVIPAFNREQFIGAAIESVLAQVTAFPIDLIVSDDGSTDSTVEVARSYGNNVRVITAPKNRGAAAARNAGIRAAQAPLIAFLDSDDLMLPDRLSIQLAFLEAHPEIGLVNAACEHESGEPAERYYQDRGVDLPPGVWTILEAPRPLIARTFFGNFSTTTLRQSLLERIGLFDETLVTLEDRELLYRAASETAFGCYNAPLAWMRTSHAGRLGRSTRWVIGAPSAWSHMLHLAPPPTDEERAVMEANYRLSVHTALSVAFSKRDGEAVQDILDEHGDAIARSARAKWRVAGALPTPVRTTLVRWLERR